MDASLSGTRALLLVGLCDGAAYGSQLIERVRRKSSGVVRLRPGNAYSTLHALKLEGLLSSQTVTPGGRRGGRARTYYDLTFGGLAAAQTQKAALAGLLSPAPVPPTDPAAMLERFRSAARISRFALSLQKRMARLKRAEGRGCYVREDFEGTALRIVRALGDRNCVLVGGLAVAAHGYVRATRDVDFVARLPLAQVQERLREEGIAHQLIRRDGLGGGFDCIKAIIDGVNVDILPQLVDVAWDLATQLPARKAATLPIVDLDSLLRLKLRAAGPQDLLDIAVLVLRHPEAKHRAEELATARGIHEQLANWLRDPRLLDQARESKDRGRRGPGERSPVPPKRLRPKRKERHR